MSVRVPAKVNLQLSVGPLRPDGFHSLATVFQAVSLHDVVTITPSGDWRVVPAGPLKHKVPTDSTNLALRAAQAVMDRYELEEDPLEITISKDIPVAGGMAGGSADAAATIVACDALWELDLEPDEMAELAAGLGSDVAFALIGGNALGTGRGEQLVPVLARHRTFHWVFAMSNRGLSTPAVFSECDRMRVAEAGPHGATSHPEPEADPNVLSALRSGVPEELAAALTNDLQNAAFSLRPDLEKLLDAGLALGALGGTVSGSGPTLAFLVPDRAAALDLSVGLTATGLADEVRWATGPVPGAHVVTGYGLG